MKKILFGVALLSVILVACSEDKLSDTSYIKDSQRVENEFDEWLYENYVKPYNIELKYRYQDMESDMTYNLVPADFKHSQVMAKLVRHLCLETYDEVTGSRDFIRSYFPKVIFLVGSNAYNNNGSVILGTAEGGRKIVLYSLNTLTAESSTPYFKTIHHEFAHILNQTKPYSTDFAQITGASNTVQYVGNSCFEVYPTLLSALKAGFISRYAATSDGEDFVELVAIYVVNTADTWSTYLNAAGDTGRAMIEDKFTIVYNYMKSEWGIDLDQLRETVLRRMSEVPTLDLETL